MRRMLFLSTVLILLGPFFAGAAFGVALPPGTVDNLTPERGFGDTMNRYTWSMGEFNDQIYAGTWSVELDYVSLVTDIINGDLDLAGYFSGGGDILGGIGYIKSTGGEIYRHEGDQDWTQVGPVSADNTGYREMIEYNGRLYAGTANSTNGTMLFRSDASGDVWESVAGGPTGIPANNSNRTMIVHDGHLYVGTENLKDGGELWRYGDEGASNPGWQKIATFTEDTSVAELTVFEDNMYVGTWDFTDSFSFYKVNGIDDFDNLTPTAAQYPQLSGLSNLGVMKLAEFKGMVYLGTVNYEGGFTLMRSANPMDVGSWEIISIDGLGDMSNAYTWTLEVFQGKLVLGTFNSGLYGGMYGPLPLDGRAELWCSTDGENWDLLMDDGFGSKYTYGIRSMVATEDTLYMGTASNFFLANPFELIEHLKALMGDVDLTEEQMAILSQFSGHFDELGAYFEGDWIGTEIYAYRGQSVPEPSTILLIGISFIGLAACARGRLPT
ncbi:MAG: PEP-CTERM sorting domain-containing protein [Desulfobacterales bacterium]|nr:PEP-CTERM sorting domain-containing protein [Desulfobacterales bacterium]